MEEVNNLPELASKSQCTGCTACVSICPRQCICMDVDVEGFAYPKIENDSVCISCGICERVCPVLNKKENSESLTKAYAAFSKNDLLRMESSSGGIFSELSKVVLQSGGIIYGASYNKNYIVEHISIDSIEKLEKLRGAKYSQSNLGESFQTIKNQLNSGEKILFSGTPCQVAGLKAFLEHDYDNLICIDFVCHGVPSPMVWKEYVKYRARTDDDSTGLKRINLRNKESGWSKYTYSVEFTYSDNKRYLCNNQDDPFMRFFVNDYILRQSCSDCHFKGYDRVSDITLGDFWGIWDVAPEMDDNKGTSLILTHSEKGEQLFKTVSENVNYKQVDLEQTSKINQSMLCSSVHQSNREQVLYKIAQEGFQSALPLFTVEQPSKVSISRKIKNVLSRLLK